MRPAAQADPAYADLLDLLEARCLLSPRWREVWARLPRHLFIPRRIWRQGPERCEAVLDEAERRRLVYADEPVVTQIDDGRDGGPGTATSSNSQPSMVAAMLQLLDVRDGDTVLEIGTATGHVAALLSERLGDEHVFSVEIDRGLARQARARLRALGYAPTVAAADGERGWARAAPYDRLVSTCALRHVPYDLVRQVRPGGTLVAPLTRDFWSGALVRLSVDADGGATGLFRGGASYMPMKSHRQGAPAPVEGPGRAGVPGCDPRELLTLGFALYAGARLPGVSMIHAEEDGPTRVWLADRAGSGATVASGEGVVWQYGPRNLWAETEAAYGEYVALGRPPADSFGLTVTPAGQEVWLRSPGMVIRAEAGGGLGSG
jgi:protein-L-isoaspartate O-methyltransferase